jgi:hypothetical protein
METLNLISVYEIEETNVLAPPCISCVIFNKRFIIKNEESFIIYTPQCGIFINLN